MVNILPFFITQALQKISKLKKQCNSVGYTVLFTIAGIGVACFNNDILILLLL